MQIRKRTIWHVFLLALCIPLVFLFWIREMQFFKVPSNSMEPTIRPNDYILTLSHKQYRRGDVVVLKDPQQEGGYLVKRIVGLPDDAISVFGGGLFLNGSYVSEPYRHEFIDYTMPPYTVGEDEFFVLGDNANWSVDSHNWSGDPENWSPETVRGIPKDSIVGRVHFIYLPWSRRGMVRPYPLTNLRGE